MERSGRLWIAGAVLVAAVYAFVVLLLPARGMTFFWDDWLILDRIVRLGRPASWLVPENQQWEPVALPFLDLEHALLGANHTLYLAVQWVLHSVNVLLLALLLRRRSGDARAAAIAAATFGVAVVWREVLWFCVDTTIVTCLLVTLAGFLAAERAREERSARWLALACVAIPVAPACWGGGMALGPTLALEAWALSPGTSRERLRRALPFAAVWGAFIVLYLAVLGHAESHAGHGFAKTPEQLRGAMLFLLEVIGLGFVEQVPLLRELAAGCGVSLGEGPIVGALLAFGYVLLVALVAFWLPEKARARILLGHAYLAFLVVPMALTRWYHNDREHPLAMASRYQYLPAITWATLIAVVLAQRPTRPVLAVALGVLVLLGLGHARAAARDGTVFSPFSRRDYSLNGLAWVRALERAARRATGPLYDTRAPVRLADPRAIRASTMLRILAPDVAPVWTSTRTPETTAPYEAEAGRGFAPDLTWR